MPRCWLMTKRLSINGSARGCVFSCVPIEQRPGRTVLRISGDNARRFFEPEAGGHRWQRVPPTERNGRRQSSTVTVAILEDSQVVPTFDERDVEFRFCVASVGAGGQNRQKNETACVAIHRPTGTEAQCQDERSQRRNRQKALAVLRQRVLGAQVTAAHKSTNQDRQSQIGCGERGDKIRTVQMHNGVVTNHVTGRKLNAERYLKGEVEAVQ
jgi:peptide chain release factor 1